MEEFLKTIDPEQYAIRKAEKEAKDKARAIEKNTAGGSVEVVPQERSREEFLQSIDRDMDLAAGTTRDSGANSANPYAHLDESRIAASSVINPQEMEDKGLVTQKSHGHKVIYGDNSVMVKVGDDWLDTARMDVPGLYTPEQEKILEPIAKEFNESVARNRDFRGDIDINVSEQNIGLPDHDLRLSISAIDEMAGKKELFKREYPTGELSLNSAGELMYKKEPADSWAKFDADFSAGGIQEVSRDVMDLVGTDGGAVLGEIIGAVTKAKNAGILATGIKSVLGTFAGDLIQESVENDFYRIDPDIVESEHFRQALLKAGFTAVGTGVFTLGAKTYNAFTGSGFLSITKEGREAILAAQKLGLPPPTIASVTRSMAWQKAEAQADSVTSKFRDYAENAQKQAKDRLTQNLRESDTEYLTKGGLKRDLDTYYENAVVMGKVNAKTRHGHGEQLKDNMETWADETARVVDGAYNKARAVEPAKMDVAGLKKKIAERDTKRQATIIEWRRKAEDLFGQQGKVVPEKVKRSLEPIDPEVQRIKTLIRSLDPDSTDLEVLKTIRTQLFDLKSPDNPLGTLSAKNRQAAKLYSDISDIMKNPLNTGPAKELYLAANDIASRRFQLLEQQQVVKISKNIQNSGSSSELITDIITKQDESSMIQLKSLLDFHSTKETGSLFRNVQEAFRNDLAEDPIRINAKLDQMPKGARDLMLNNADEAMLRTVGEEIQDLADTGIQKALSQQGSAKDLVKKVMLSKNQGDVLKLEKFASEHPQAEKAIKSGLMEVIVDKVTLYGVKESQEINDRALNTIIHDVVNTEVGKKFLHARDKQMLQAMAPLLKLYTKQGDIGSNLLGAQIIAGVTRLQASAIAQLIKYNGLANVMTNKSFIRFMTGKGNKPSRKFVTQMITQTAAELKADQLSEYWDKKLWQAKQKVNKIRGVGAF